MENSPILHLKYLYFDVSLYFYYICPGATDSVNMSEVDSVVENFVRDALSQCDQSTVSETFKRVHSEGCFLGRKSYIHEKHSQDSIEFNFKILILGNAWLK